MDDAQRRHDDATRLELRRLVTHAQAPGETPIDAFGPWAEYIEPLRAAHARGVDAVRSVFWTLTKMTPALGRLLSSDPDPRPTGWEMDDLYTADLPEPTWVVPDILRTGLGILAGKPKLGKSWLALQIATAVGRGGRVLNRDVEQKRTLYIALEDTDVHMQERVQAQGFTPPFNFRVEFEWPFLHRGGLAQLEETIVNGGYQLVLIDTLSSIMGGADQMDHAQMTLMIGALHNLTRRTGVAILIVDHHRKLSPLGQRDAISDIIGSTAKAAIADVAIGMYEGSDKAKAILEICPRDWASLKLALAWDPQASAWQAVGDAHDARRTETQAAILDAIRELSLLGELTTTTNIAGHLSSPKSSVSRELAALLGSGKIVKGERQGRAVPYLVADDAESDQTPDVTE